MNNIAVLPWGSNMPRGIDYALLAASLGWRVFPLTESNVPFPHDAVGVDPNGFGGVYLATTDDKAIRALWSGNRSNARIGLAMGNGIMAIDCDEKNGKSGSATMRAKGWTLPQTACQRTQSDGAHYIVKTPDGIAAPTDAGSLGEGLDRRGDAGYIALYHTAMLSMNIADAPEWCLINATRRGDRIAPGQGKRSPSYSIALNALQSRNPGDMERNEWLLISGSFCASTDGLVDDDQALSDWQAWNVAYGPRNDPTANARTWADFRKHGTNGDFATLASLSDSTTSTAIAWHLFGGVDRNGQLPATSNARPILSAHNFFVRASDMEYRPPEYNITDLIETDALAVLFGDPATGKSFIAIDMACCVATGSDFHGHEVKQGPVFYIAGEGRNGIKRRIDAWEKHNDTMLGDRPLYVSIAAAQFLDSESATTVTNAIAALAYEHGCPRLIFIDTLARNFGNGDENSQKDMTAFINAMDALRTQFTGCTVIIVHHSGHGDKDRARGSSVLKGAVDAEYKTTKADDNRIKLTNHKMKDGPPPPSMEFQLESVGHSAALTYLGEPTTQTNGLSKVQQNAWDAFNDCGGYVVATEQWRDQFYAKRQGSDEANRKAFQRARQDLVKLNIVMTDDGGANYRRSPMPGMIPPSIMT